MNPEMLVKKTVLVICLKTILIISAWPSVLMVELVRQLIERYQKSIGRYKSLYFQDFLFLAFAMMVLYVILRQGDVSKRKAAAWLKVEWVLIYDTY